MDATKALSADTRVDFHSLMTACVVIKEVRLVFCV